ncbi:MAG: hypothetical protein KAQ85_04625 [Thermodesulfovibrionia bacterium]|nr:hypothetical protein [Thermodesulfovibrionia bacterium]
MINTLRFMKIVGFAVPQEQLNPKPLEGMVVFALNLFKASAAPEGKKSKYAV